MTDLYHGNHYDVITLPRGASGAAIHGGHSTEFKDSDDLGCLPISRKVPVEAQFETPAIVRERWRSCLKILCLQTPGKYDDGRPGSGIRVRGREREREQKLKEQNSEINLSNGSIRQP